MTMPPDPDSLPFRDVGDAGRVRPPEWFLRDLLGKAAELFAAADFNHDDPEWNVRADRWRQIWESQVRDG